MYDEVPSSCKVRGTLSDLTVTRHWLISLATYCRAYSSVVSTQRLLVKTLQTVMCSTLDDVGNHVS